MRAIIYIIIMMTKKNILTFVVLFFAAGIFVQDSLGLPFKWLAVGAVFCFFSEGVLLSRPRMALVILAALMVCLGGVYSASYQELPKDHLYSIAKYYYGRPVAIEGVVASDPVKRKFHHTEKTTFHLNVKRFLTKWGWKKKSGKLMVNSFRDAAFSYGDYVRLEGKIHRPFEASKEGRFSYRAYLNRKGIKLILSIKKQGRVAILNPDKGYSIRAASLKIKHHLQGILSMYLSQNEASIMRAILLGDRHQVPKHIRELFQISGVAHILAISGLHIGIVASLIFLFLKMLPIPRRLHFFLTICILIFYAFITGGRPSVIRATIMAGVILGGLIVEREVESFNTLSLAALIILFMNPLNLFDVGFQLSFVSVFTIISFYPKLNRFFTGLLRNPGSNLVKYVIQFFCVSLSAYAGVAGLIGYYFHIVTPVALVANLVVVPLIAVIVALGMGLLLAGLAWPPLACAFAICIKALLNAMVAFIYLCVKIPGAYFFLDGMPVWGVALYYCLLILIVWAKKGFVVRHEAV